MRKIVLIGFLLIITILNSGAFGKPKKIKCKKPIYFFEDVKKDEYFNYLDNTIQQEKYKLEKMYPELGYLSVNYRVKKEVVPVGILLKQFGNDIYLFIDIDKKNTSLEKNIYNSLKKHTKNSYLMNDDLFCRQLTKDAASIRTGRKAYLQETQYIPGTYVIHMKRYVGYDKKTPLWMKRQQKKEEKAKKTKNSL